LSFLVLNVYEPVMQFLQTRDGGFLAPQALHYANNALRDAKVRGGFVLACANHFYFNLRAAILRQLLTVGVPASVARTALGGVSVAFLALSTYAARESGAADEFLSLVGLYIRETATRLLDRRRRPQRCDASDVRGYFSEAPFLLLKARDAHTHPESAALRTGAVHFCEAFARRLTYRPFFVGQSRTDQRLTRDGCRSFYFPKDAGMQFSPEDCQVNDLRIHIDTDYYYNMPAELVKHPVPTLLYSMVPIAASRACGETSYRFNVSGELEVSVAGGATYSHPLWDYGADTLVAANWWHYVVYGVERTVVGLDRQVILLVPTAHWSGVWSWIARWVMPHRPLQRMSPVDSNGFVRISTQTPTGMRVSTGIAGQFVNATISAVHDGKLLAYSRVLTTKMSTAHVGNCVKNEVTEADSLQVLVDYYGRKQSDTGPIVYAPNERVHRYTPSFAPLEEESKPAIVPFMQPLVGPAYCAMLSRSMEAAAIETRVESVRSDVRVFPPDIAAWVTEFIHHIYPAPNTVRMYTDEEVWERQNRPEQRRLISAAIPCEDDDSRNATGMLKAEAHGEVQDVRIITIIETDDKVEYSKVIYALQAELKRVHWYAFGKTPRDIAETVADIASTEDEVHLHDCSRMDGHKAAVVRGMEDELIMWTIVLDERERALKAAKKHRKLRVRMDKGAVFESEDGQSSGAADTAYFNTILNAVMAYCALRRLGFSAQNAWRLLGLYGGDDGFSRRINSATLSETGRAFGQVIVTDTVRKGECIKFLARVYGPGVWWGEPDSMCDIRRQAMKFHTTKAMRPGVTPVDKLLQKALSFMATDANTPLIGPLVRRALDLRPRNHKLVTDRAVARWGDQYSDDVQYPNAPGDWMMDELHRALPEFQYDAFVAAVDSARFIDDLLNLPTYHDIPPVEGKPGYDVDRLDDNRATATAAKAWPERALLNADPTRMSAADVPPQAPAAADKAMQPAPVNSGSVETGAKGGRTANTRKERPPRPNAGPKLAADAPKVAAAAAAVELSDDDKLEIERRTAKKLGFARPPRTERESKDIPAKDPERLWRQEFGRQKKAYKRS
jgi:hypothetical protein